MWQGLINERGWECEAKQPKAYRVHDTPSACHSRSSILLGDTEQNQKEHRFWCFMALGSYFTICVMLERLFHLSKSQCLCL